MGSLRSWLRQSLYPLGGCCHSGACYRHTGPHLRRFRTSLHSVLGLPGRPTAAAAVTVSTPTATLAAPFLKLVKTAAATTATTATTGCRTWHEPLVRGVAKPKAPTKSLEKKNFFSLSHPFPSRKEDEHVTCHKRKFGDSYCESYYVVLIRVVVGLSILYICPRS